LRKDADTAVHYKNGPATRRAIFAVIDSH